MHSIVIDNNNVKKKIKDAKVVDLNYSQYKSKNNYVIEMLANTTDDNGIAI